ncbi:zinc-binding alcohol dehydrogenase family protein [Tahibacter harae]|uniref:Zinc-type alcohol dehydrogenase-like protein n=1 Tax=Tahibacter harae TaxID=2963937 RepID=A0ABT1QMV8_9GAMM|nr:zinc-binding alcohol dehydrogenase family protein [Tahibacter harae]MCQ4163870.1 zinc-binding alcohol dehydrogenase family protein [Tahibacter harae]
MKAIGYYKNLPIDDAHALVDLDLPEPQPGPRDLLVEIRAVSVNPVDTKLRRNAAPAEGQARVLGFDAAGVVRAVGSEVSLFKPGDRVWHAGSIVRPGSNAELQLVDERIAGHMPASLDFAQAAALPLTAITAWELLFDRLQVSREHSGGQTLLVTGAAGGVGSILVQLARRLTGLRVIGTASRAETRDWVLGLGAHDVLDHSRPLAGELGRIGVSALDYVASLTHTDQHYDAFVEALRPQGRLGLIDDPATPLDVMKLKRKALSLHWEMMFTRPLFETPDMIEQHRLLGEVARLIDAGVIRTTLGEHYGRIDAATLRRAHALIESGKARGKIVLEGFAA